MRRVTFLWIAMLCFLVGSSQDYKVVHVKGQIQAVSKKELLKRGTDFKKEERFKYITKDARAVVVNTTEGKRMILQKPKNGANTVNAGLTPSMGNISSRSGALLNHLDVNNYFTGELVVLDQLKVKIVSDKYPQNESQFFFLKFVYEGDTINKKLPFAGDSLIISKDSIYKVDGKPIQLSDTTVMQLYYYSNIDGKVKVTLVSDQFKPIFPDLEVLKEEIDLMLSVLPEDSELDRKEYIHDYIYDAYGKTNRQNVEWWLENNYLPY